MNGRRFLFKTLAGIVVVAVGGLAILYAWDSANGDRSAVSIRAEEGLVLTLHLSCTRCSTVETIAITAEARNLGILPAHYFTASIGDPAITVLVEQVGTQAFRRLRQSNDPERVKPAFDQLELAVFQAIRREVVWDRSLRLADGSLVASAVPGAYVAKAIMGTGVHGSTSEGTLVAQLEFELAEGVNSQ